MLLPVSAHCFLLPGFRGHRLGVHQSSLCWVPWEEAGMCKGHVEPRHAPSRPRATASYWVVRPHKQEQAVHRCFALQQPSHSRLRVSSPGTQTSHDETLFWVQLCLFQTEVFWGQAISLRFPERNSSETAIKTQAILPTAVLVFYPRETRSPQSRVSHMPELHSWGPAVHVRPWLAGFQQKYSQERQEESGLAVKNPSDVQEAGNGDSNTLFLQVRDLLQA